MILILVIPKLQKLIELVTQFISQPIFEYSRN
ncbi:MAG: hypothetical protein K0S67_1562 [Nitrososphaeraceae archaeon]|jgi:hypothetical protein|nr:hypothetical protein [Nitrososphaeraceae archaeon]